MTMAIGMGRRRLMSQQADYDMMNQEEGMMPIQKASRPAKSKVAKPSGTHVMPGGKTMTSEQMRAVFAKGKNKRNTPKKRKKVVKGRG